MYKTPQLGHVLNEGLCKTLISKYFRRTQRGGERQAVVLHELIHEVYAQGHQAGRGAKQQPKETT